MAAAAAAAAAPVQLLFVTPEERAEKAIEAVRAVFGSKFNSDVRVTAERSRYQLSCAVSAVDKKAESVTIDLERLVNAVRELEAHCHGSTVSDVVCDLRMHSVVMNIAHSPAPGSAVAAAVAAKSGAKRKVTSTDSDDDDDDDAAAAEGGDEQRHAKKRRVDEKVGTAPKSAVEALRQKAENICGGETPADVQCEVISSTELQVSGYHRVTLPQIHKFFLKFAEYVRRYHDGRTPRCVVDLAKRMFRLSACESSHRPVAAAAAAAAARETVDRGCGK